MERSSSRRWLAASPLLRSKSGGPFPVQSGPAALLALVFSRWMASEVDQPDRGCSASPANGHQVDRALLGLFLDSLGELHLPDRRRNEGSWPTGKSNASKTERMRISLRIRSPWMIWRRSAPASACARCRTPSVACAAVHPWKRWPAARAGRCARSITRRPATDDSDASGGRLRLLEVAWGILDSRISGFSA